jgi:lipid-A-disaccharide synthase
LAERLKKDYNIMIVVGEASGDAHAALLVNALRKNHLNIGFYGSTCEKLRELGVETIVNADNFSVVGLPEVLRNIPMFWKAFKTLKQTAIERKPDAVILVDFPEFNLKLAKSLKKAGLKVVYYISPQLWAWRKYRVRGIKRDVDLLLTILPFEKDFYAKHNINNVEFVGNPLAGEVKSKLTKAEFCAKHNLDANKPIISLLAGSRRAEVERILPILLETANLMSLQNNDLQFVVALASTRKISEFETAKQHIGTLPKHLIIVQNETFEALHASDASAVTSGTATLETAIIGTPLVVVYKTSELNWRIFRPLIDTEHFGLVNLIAGERLAKELIHANFDAETLAKELFCLLESETNLAMRKRLLGVKKSLGEGGTSERAAGFILKTLGS